MDKKTFSFGQAFALLLVAAYAPSLLWWPTLGSMPPQALLMFPFSPVVLPLLVWDFCFPLMPYGRTGVYAAGVNLLLCYMGLLLLLAARLRQSRKATWWGAGILAVASLLQGIVFSIWVRMLV
jgi:hypothetical protein